MVTPATPDTADSIGATTDDSKGGLFTSGSSAALVTIQGVISELVTDAQAIETRINDFGLAGLTDVTVTSISDNELLQYDSGTSKWINQTLAEAGAITASSSDTLTNKTLTSPVFNTGVSGSAVLDSDTMSGASATTLATSESIKAYVDSRPGDISEVIAGTGMTGGGASGAVTLNVIAGTGITANADDIAVNASQTQITALGTIGTGTWQGTAIADTYLATISTAGKVALGALEIDGGTDVGADLLDADLIIIDDGAGGANRKSTLTRTKKYIYSAISSDATASDAGVITLADGDSTRTNLGLAIGSDVQAYDADLAALGGLAKTDSNFIVGNGSTWVAETGATARTSLGLGTAAILATGISDTNVPKFTSGVADDDFLRVDGTAIEGRSASEVLSDIGAITASSSDTLTNKTLTSPVFNTGISGDAFLDQDDMSSNSATKVASQQSIKAYVDSVASGLDVKDSVVIATTADVSSWTYNNGSSGVGATLTASGNGAVTIDDIALDALNMRILVKDQDPATENGIYYISTVGTGAATLVLTRSTDADTNTELTSGAFVFAEKGTVNSDKGFVMTQDTTITFGSTTIVWSQFSGAGQITAGTGLTKSGDTLNLDTHSLTEAAIANGDYLIFNDATDSNAPKREALADVATLFAGTGLTASSSVIGVDASQTQITSVGTIGTGTWQGSAVADGYISSASTWNSKQAGDAGLTSISGLTTAANKMIYTTDSDVYAVTALTTAGRAILDDADAAAQRTTLGLAIGTNVQAYDAQLDTLAGLTANQVGGLVDLATLEAPASDGQFIVATGSGVFAYESGATARTSIGLGNVENTALSTGNAATATALASAVNIGGVSFNGTGNIDLPGVNTAGNQNTSGTAALATAVTATANNTADETVYPTFVDGATGTQGIETDTGLNYNPSTGVLTSTTFTGNLTGDASGSAATATTATNVTVSDESSDTTSFPLFATAATGNLPPKSGSNLTFNSSSGTLAATAFSGDGSNLTSVPASVSGAQTAITSILNAALVVGRDADNQIKFSTDDQIIFEVSGGDNVIFKASGEIEATSLDIGSGGADINGTLEADVITVAGVALSTVIANEATALAIALG